MPGGTSQTSHPPRGSPAASNSNPQSICRSDARPTDGVPGRILASWTIAHMPDPTPSPAAKRTLVERLLSPFAEVRHHEAASVLLMTLLMFLLLAAYYMLKTAREVFILTEGGAEVKSYSSAGQAILLLGLVPAYGAFASRVNRVRLVRWVTLFFASNLVLFVLAVRAGLRRRHRLLPVGRHLQPHGHRPVLGVRQRHLHGGAGQAALPADRRRQQPRRLGRRRSRRQISWAASGPTRLLIGAGAVLVVCAFLAQLVDRVTTRDASAGQSADAEKPLGREGGFELIRKDRYLLLIALPDGAAQRRQHVGRIPLRPLRRRTGERRCTGRPRSRRPRASASSARPTAGCSAR